MTLSGAVYAADKTIEISRCELPYVKIGTTHRHRVPMKWPPVLIDDEYPVEDSHVGCLADVHDVAVAALVFIYSKCDTRQFDAYSMRRGLLWYYCEKCRVVFWIHIKSSYSIFPLDAIMPFGNWIYPLLDDHGNVVS